jgi:hypothetical protein
MMEKHGNVEERLAASVFSSDVTHQGGTDERERGSSATHQDNVTHLTVPTQVMGVSQVAANTNCTFSSQLYQRLPHPLANFLKEIPVVDGADVNTLWDFLSKAVHIRRVGQVQDQHMLELLHHYCRDSLLTQVVESLSLGRQPIREQYLYDVTVNTPLRPIRERHVIIT